jgi:hypothetical protein
MRFRTTIQLNGKTATGIEVPEEVIEKLGSGKRPPVRITVNDHTYRSTVAPRGERYLVGVSAENREGAGVAAGDEVDVEIELDTSPREVAVSPDFAVERDADAKRFFESLTHSQKQWYVLPIEARRPRESARRPRAQLGGALPPTGGPARPWSAPSGRRTGRAWAAASRPGRPGARSCGAP